MLEQVESQQKIAQLVAAQLREKIANGELGIGERLPSEAKMIEMFQISRGSLREALRILEVESLIRSSRGDRKGAEVTEPNIKRLAEFASLFLAIRGATVGDVHRARLFLEPSVVHYIAGSEHRAAVARELDDCVARMEEECHNDNLRSAGLALEQFHATLVRRSDNVTLQLLMSILAGVLNENMILAMIGNREQNVGRLKEKFIDTCAKYRRLTDLIRAGEGAAAHGLWQNYMEQSLRFLQEAGMDANPVRYTRGP